MAAIAESPKPLKVAMNTQEANLWRAAAEEEIQSLTDNHAMQIINRDDVPKDRKRC
ncbi:hypothetical protein K470DRAFT_287202, partial [Piedraia hortae CBS 480.64]